MQVVTILRHCEITLTEARTYLDIATDPSMDLARSLEQARNKKLEIEARMAGYEGSCIALMQELNKEKEKSAGLEKKVEELTRERNRLDKKIAKTMESNPSAIYDAFPPRSSTPGGQKKSK